MVYTVCGIETFKNCIKLHLQSFDAVLNDGVGFKVLSELVPKNQEYESLRVGDKVRTRTVNFNGVYRTIIYL